jgi:hypothetical protein
MRRRFGAEYGVQLTSHCLASESQFGGRFLGESPLALCETTYKADTDKIARVIAQFRSALSVAFSLMDNSASPPA